MSNMEMLIGQVEEWAAERGILSHSTPIVQLCKTFSELGELADASIKHDHAGIMDGIGDVMVTLVIFAKLQGLSVTGCLDSAYQTIKHRKGRLSPTGVFVKEEPGEAAD